MIGNCPANPTVTFSRCRIRVVHKVFTLEIGVRWLRSGTIHKVVAQPSLRRFLAKENLAGANPAYLTILCPALGPQGVSGI